MPFNKRFIGSLAFAAFVVTSGQAFAAASPTGVWMNDTGRGAVEITQCGGNLCGKVVWVKDAIADSKGCGRQIMGDVAPVGGNTWDNGWIYSPERKKRFDVELKPLSDGTLKVTGYAGMKFLSKTMIWKKAPADLVRCDQQVAAAPTSATVKEETVVKSETKTAAVAPVVTPAEKPAEKAEADEPQAEEEVASEDSGSSDSPFGGDGSELADKLGQFMKKGANGRCKLDLPWVKLDFKCEK